MEKFFGKYGKTMITILTLLLGVAGYTVNEKVTEYRAGPATTNIYNQQAPQAPAKDFTPDIEAAITAHKKADH